MLNQLRQLMGSGSIFGYFLQVLPISLLAGVVWLVLRLCQRKKRQLVWSEELLRLVFVCYVTGLISLIVLPANFWLYVYDGIFLGWWDELLPIFRIGEINLVPSIVKCLRGELVLGSWVKTMLVGNVAMFLPFGLILPFLLRGKRRKMLLSITLLTPPCLEGLQLFFGRSFDIDDLLCNFFGILLGALVAFAILRGSAHRKQKHQNLK